MHITRNYHLWILEQFIPFIGKNLLEVGAGTGAFSQFILDVLHPDSLVCLEPSPRMYRRLNRKLKDRPNAYTIHGRLNEAGPLFRHTIDTILYVNVLEHILADSAELEQAHQYLKRGGCLCIFVPALQLLFSRFDTKLGHKRRYNKKSLKSLVEAAGFEVLKCRYMDLLGIAPWWISFCLLRQQSIGADRAATYDRFIVPVVRKLEGLVTPPIGKNILMVCRKI